MKKLIGFLFAVVVLLSFTPHAEAIIVELPTIADAYVYENSPTTRFGSMPFLLAGGSTGLVYNTFLKFNIGLISDIATVNSSYLWLHVSNVYTSGTLNVNAVNDTTWTDDPATGITWNSQPAMGDPMASLTGPISSGWLSFDLGAPDPSEPIPDVASLAVYASGGSYYGFFSKEYSGVTGTQYIPYLEIDYTPIPEPCSLFLISLGLLGAGIFKRRVRKV